MTLALAGVGSMLAAVVGSLLPWVSYSSRNVGGIHRDGKIMIALGLVGLVFGVLGLVLEYRWPFYALALLGISIAALSLLDIIDVSTTPGLGLSNVGIGLFIGAAAGIVAVISGVGGISLHTDS